MKHIATGVVIVVLIILFLTAGMTITIRQEKEAEVSESLKESIKETIENSMNMRQYDVRNNDEFLADFCQALLDDIQMGSGSESDPNLKIKVDVAGVDYEKGFLSLKVTETFSYPLYGTGETSCNYTVIYDKTHEKEFVTTTYQFEDERIYRVYKLQEGDAFIYPSIDPEYLGQKFIGWKDAKGNIITKANCPATATKDTIYTAVFQK